MRGSSMMKQKLLRRMKRTPILLETDESSNFHQVLNNIWRLTTVQSTERNVVPKVIRTGNEFIGMNFLGLQFMDTLNFLRGATSLDNFLKAYGASEEKGFFPYEWFDSNEKLIESQLPPIECFWGKFKNHNVLSVDYGTFMDCKKKRNLRKRNLREIEI